MYVALACCLFDLACFFLPSHLSCTCRGSSFFLGKVTALGVLCCFALFVCLFDLACFFLSSFSSLIKTCTFVDILYITHKVSTAFSPSLSLTLHVAILRIHLLLLHRDSAPSMSELRRSRLVAVAWHEVLLLLLLLLLLVMAIALHVAGQLLRVGSGGRESG